VDGTGGSVGADGASGVVGVAGVDPTDTSANRVPCDGGEPLLSFPITISVAFGGDVGSGGGGTSAVGNPCALGAGGGASDGLNVSAIDPIDGVLAEESAGGVCADEETGESSGCDRTSFFANSCATTSRIKALSASSLIIFTFPSQVVEI